MIASCGPASGRDAPILDTGYLILDHVKLSSIQYPVAVG